MGAFDRKLTPKQKANEVVKNGFVLLVLAAAFYPLFMMVNISFKTNQQFFHNRWWPEAPFHLENYVQGWMTIGSSIPNTIYLTVVTTAGVLAVALMASYVFARFHFPFKRILWAAFLILLLMPAIANLVPLFILLRDIGLLNTYTAIIITGIAGGQVFNIYILTNYIEDMPETLFEAAEMDGAGHLRQIWDVVIPMNGSIIATLACLQFVQNWNRFLLPLLVIRDPERLPMAVALFRLEGAYAKEWGPTMAAYAIAAIPMIILFIFTMRYFIRGVGAGAIKG